MIVSIFEQAKFALVRLTGLLGVILYSTSLLAIEVTRGPYLQRATTNEITIKWRTDEQSDSVVHIYIFKFFSLLKYS